MITVAVKNKRALFLIECVVSDGRRMANFSWCLVLMMHQKPYHLSLDISFYYSLIVHDDDIQSFILSVIQTVTAVKLYTDKCTIHS